MESPKGFAVPAMNEPRILSVSALTGAVKGTLEGVFPFVWVRGQITNLSRPSSGHVYFSLRDEGASLAAVWFKGNQKVGERFDPLTGEVYEDGPKPSLAHSLENGMEIVCAGRLSVYAQRGAYQLVVELAQPSGLGRLHEEFERLKAKLAAAGYFAQERKRPLPAHPSRVAVVTAPTGAAVHDFLRIAAPRGCAAEIRIYPALMQGESAPAQIAAAVRTINAEGWAEVVVLIRGGGSLEDLWAFNTSETAEAVLSSRIPVLAGIGHEVDVTLADMTADVRAATPSHAAQLLWPERREMREALDALVRALERGKTRRLERNETEFASLARGLSRAGKALPERLSASLDLLGRAVEWHSPRRRIAGYHDRLLDMNRRLHPAAERNAAGKDAVLHAVVLGLERAKTLPDRLDFDLRVLADRLPRARDARLNQVEQALDVAEIRLAGLDPRAPLERGYALVRKQDGTFVRSPAETAAEERLTITVRDGEIPVRVEGAGS